MNNNKPPVKIVTFWASIKINTGIISDIAHGAQPIENRIPKKNAPKYIDLLLIVIKISLPFSIKPFFVSVLFSLISFDLKLSFQFS